jgi:hypothetical protein
MAQELTVNIKTTSDVPQAMDRAKSATVSFGKQVDDIQKKFSMAFKDVFLSVLGPMALIGIAMNYIGKLIDDNRKKQEDANQAAIKGTNDLMSAEDKYYANKKNKEKESKEKVEEAETQRVTTSKVFLEQDPRGKAMVDEVLSALPPGMRAAAAFNTADNMSRQKSVQDKIQVMIAEDIKADPLAEEPDAAAAQTAAQKASDDAAKAKGTTFKGPEGFSNVVGVGANPVIEAMTLQLEETRKQTALLEILANPGGGGVPIDFTKIEQTTMTT